MFVCGIGFSIQTRKPMTEVTIQAMYTGPNSGLADGLRICLQFFICCERQVLIGVLCVWLELRSGIWANKRETWGGDSTNQWIGSVPSRRPMATEETNGRNIDSELCRKRCNLGWEKDKLAQVILAPEQRKEGLSRVPTAYYPGSLFTPIGNPIVEPLYYTCQLSLSNELFFSSFRFCCRLPFFLYINCSIFLS